MRKASIAPAGAQLNELQNCMCFKLRQAARAVTQVYDEALRPTGLRATQHSLLRIIEAVETVSVSNLAEMAVMDRTTLTRNLELLKREGLVRIQPGVDARVREVTLTDGAHKRLAAALPYWAKAQAQVTEELGQIRSERILSDLSAAVGAAQMES
jgi:DNA-binding MarR family transcriptional regulator